MLVIFFLSLLAIGLIYGIKSFEIKNKKESWLTKYFKQGDEPIENFWLHLKKEASYITWKNFILLSRFVYQTAHLKAVSIKRQYDSRQPKFLLAVNSNADNKNKKNPSKFLKTINDHKNKIRKMQ